MFCKNCGNEIKDDATFCDKCGKQVTEKPKKKVNKKFIIIGIAIAIITLLSLGGFFRTFSKGFDVGLNRNKYINIVKEGAFTSIPNVTVGTMVDTVFSSVKWDAIVATDEEYYVNMDGLAPNGAKVLLQFKILENGGWQAVALEINGEATPMGDIATDLYILYEAAKK